MNNVIRSGILNKLAESIDIPDSAYERAYARYKDLGNWFSREESSCYDFSPHVYSQGSFRLGTVIRPLDKEGEYDLDMGCRLMRGITKATHTQQELKKLVGADLEDYRLARGIEQRKEEKSRCWRLRYADPLRFHLDTVPSIPEARERKQFIREAIIRSGTAADLAELVSDLTGAITDNRKKNYHVIDDDWLLSNSEGFALWFESRIRLNNLLMEELKLKARAVKVDEFPAYQWKSPLQRCVQLLKRHRDIMFVNSEDEKPASIIITALSARAYQGETEIGSALDTILSTMGKLINQNSPRVANPVSPAEDFADRWSDPAYESSFWFWLRKAQLDFEAIGKERKPELIVRAASDKLGALLNESEISTIIGANSASALLKAAAVPRTASFPDKPLVPKKPAGFA